MEGGDMGWCLLLLTPLLPISSQALQSLEISGENGEDLKKKEKDSSPAQSGGIVSASPPLSVTGVSLSVTGVFLSL